MEDIPELQAYPHIQHAVALVELFYSKKEGEDNSSALDIMIDAGFSPEKVIATMKNLTDEDIADNQPGRLNEARTEMDHPEFLKYIRGKLGCF